MEILPHVIIFGMLGFILTISWFPNSSYFSWHPTLMATAFLGLFCESVLLFHPRFSPVSNHALRVKLHQAFNITGCLLAACGMFVIYNLKESAGKEHITTWHALTGLLAMILCGVQALGGIPIVYTKIKSALRLNQSLKEMKKKHAQLGLITMLCALTAIALSFYSTWFEKKEFHRVYQHVTFGAVTTIMGVIVAQVYGGRLSNDQ